MRPLKRRTIRSTMARPMPLPWNSAPCKRSNGEQLAGVAHVETGAVVRNAVDRLLLVNRAAQPDLGDRPCCTVFPGVAEQVLHHHHGQQSPVGEDLQPGLDQAVQHALGRDSASLPDLLAQCADVDFFIMGNRAVDVGQSQQVHGELVDAHRGRQDALEMLAPAASSLSA